ncbi:ATP-grasp domain-containing protein [Actinoplanes sp. NPDC051475]|uniref:ATP-grasp domain-containing protein n=1 Tax=Actinoplanes sp. NPDC051475 TaxID=3157225 RepID=UPI00344C2C69
MPTLTRKEHIVVVDAYSGGKYLLAAYQALGFPVLHVQSGPIDYYAADNAVAAQRAERHLSFDGDLDALVDELRATPVRAVLAGSEGGVLLADQLADQLDVPFRNDLSSSLARRDKFVMQEQIRAAGLAAIAQARVSDPAELDAWLADHDAYPVVVKPLRSAATDGVHICRSRDEAQTALAVLRAHPDMFGQPNTSVLVQEFLGGTEYVLNGIACDGRYVFTEGWLSRKVDNAGYPVYDTQYLFYRGDPGFEQMSAYVVEVCRALGIVNGPFHAEVMLTADGAVLIEIAARVAGGADPYVVETCLGHSQIRLLVEASLHPAQFRESYRERPAERPYRRAAYVYLISPAPGRVKGVDLEDFLQIDGVIRADYKYQVGDLQKMTRDLITAAGLVLVSADDPDRLDAAVARIRATETQMYARNVTEESPIDE